LADEVITVQKIFTSGFYNAMQVSEVSTRPNWISDQKSWRYKGNFRTNHHAV